MYAIESKQLMAEARTLTAWGRQNGLLAESRRMDSAGEKIGPFPVRVWMQSDNTWKGACEGLRGVADTEREAALNAAQKHITKVLRKIGHGQKTASVELVSPGMWRAFVVV